MPSRSRRGSLRHQLTGIALALTLLSAAATPADAIVGGQLVDGPVGAGLVMVLVEGGASCSGIVLTQDVVLTAGHCIPPGRQIRVYAPSHNAASEAPHLIALAGRAVHPGFAANAAGTRRRSVDLGLLRLAERLPDGYAPLQLAEAAAPGAGATILTAGDGLAEEGRANSSGKPRRASLSVIEPYGRSTILLWAAPAAGGVASGACSGDSGGAMLTPDDTVVAVIAFAEGQGRSRCGKLTQGVLVAPQRSFIDTTLAKWGEAARWTEH